MVAANKGWAGVVRSGGIGDNIIASSVLPGLKKRYGHVEVLSTEPHHVVFLNNPYIDKLSVHDPADIPLDTNANWHWIRSKEFEFYAHLSHSNENFLAFFSSQYQFQWPQEARRKFANRSYLEVAHDIALVPYDEIAPNFFPTEAELADVQAIKQKIGGRFIAWVIKGTRVDKAHPYAPSIIARLIQDIRLPVVLMGSERELEIANAIRNDLIQINGDASGLRMAITDKGDDWPIRRSLAFAQQADLVIGPDTGVLWACAMHGMPKIALLSHASPENITKHWRNTVTLHADAGRVDCWPCHRLHENMVTCRPNRDNTGAACISDISVKTVVQEAQKLLASGTIRAASRPRSQSEICTYKHGRLICFPGDPYMGHFLAQYGQYSEGEVALFRRIVQPDDAVIEVGANIGCHTVPLARMCRFVLAVEPQAPLFHALCGNLALNAVFNAQPINMAAGAEIGSCIVPMVDYQASGVNFGGISMLPAGSEGRQVLMTTLDALAGQGVPNLTLIKADVEGMEWDVLTGAQRLISEHRPYLYLEDDREDKRERLHALLRDLGYRMYRHLPPYVVGQAIVSVNLFCVPQERELADELVTDLGLFLED